MNLLYDEIKNYIDAINADLLLVHTDLLRGFVLPQKADENLVNEHCRLIRGFAKDIYIPAFNYDFPKKRIFNVKETPSRIGVINEHFRKHFADWQTPVPVFSFSGTGNLPPINCDDIIDPFESNSVFGYLYKKDSLLMHYGSGIAATTIIHFVERISNLLLYRYDKYFKGTVINNGGSETEITLKLHVRPLNMNLDYDWDRLEKELNENSLIKYFIDGPTSIKIIRIRDLVDFWLQKIKDNSLYLLNKESLEWVKPMLDRLKRPFVLSDFEEPEQSL